MKITRKIILSIIGLIVSGLLFSRFFSRQAVSENEQPVNAPKKANIVVRVTKAQKQDFTLTFDYVGSLKAKDEASVFSKVSGKLAEYLVNEGDTVAKGQIIANVDRDETGLKFELAKVESPIAGVVGRILLDKGANITPASTVVNSIPLAVVVDMDEMIVRLNIPEQDIPYFKKGLQAILKVDSYPDDQFPGEVTRVAEIVDTQTRTLPIEIAIPNTDHRLKSGMFARITIIAAKLKDVLVLSQDAIVQELGEKFVFTVRENIAEKRKVVLGKRDNGKLQVLDGIREGDAIIVFGQQGLKDGAHVTLSNNQE
jgi:multidrug efflux pump subunit AcrA (membrane-fusion protein)